MAENRDQQWLSVHQRFLISRHIDEELPHKRLSQTHRPYLDRHSSKEAHEGALSYRLYCCEQLSSSLLKFDEELLEKLLPKESCMRSWTQPPSFSADSLKTSQSGEGFNSSHFTPVSRSIAGQCSAGTFPLASQFDGALGETSIFDAKAATPPAISIAFLSAFMWVIILTFVSGSNTFVSVF
jgi:hypothetical protein